MSIKIENPLMTSSRSVGNVMIARLVGFLLRHEFFNDALFTAKRFYLFTHVNNLPRNVSFTTEKSLAKKLKTAQFRTTMTVLPFKRQSSFIITESTALFIAKTYRFSRENQTKQPIVKRSSMDIFLPTQMIAHFIIN